MSSQPPKFKSTQQAVIWSVEILRAAQNPPVASVYQKLKELKNGIDQPFQVMDPAHSGHLDRHHWALDIKNTLQKHLNADEYQLLHYHYWGDYATPERLTKARKVQEICRREGKRVRLSWRYSYRQLATIMQVSDKTIAKRLIKIEEKAGRILQKAQFLSLVEKEC